MYFTLASERSLNLMVRVRMFLDLLFVQEIDGAVKPESFQPIPSQSGRMVQQLVKAATNSVGIVGSVLIQLTTRKEREVMEYVTLIILANDINVAHFHWR